MIWFILDILLLRRLGLIRPIRYAILVVILGGLIAGMIYAAAIFHALAERNQAPHVQHRSIQ
jgi:hypothetical protein